MPYYQSPGIKSSQTDLAKRLFIEIPENKRSNLMASKYKKNTDFSTLTDKLGKKRPTPKQDIPSFQKEMTCMIEGLGFPYQDKEIQALSKDLHYKQHCNSEIAKESTSKLENRLFIETVEQTINDVDTEMPHHKQEKP